MGHACVTEDGFQLAMHTSVVVSIKVVVFFWHVEQDALSSA